MLLSTENGVKFNYVAPEYLNLDFKKCVWNKSSKINFTYVSKPHKPEIFVATFENQSGYKMRCSVVILVYFVFLTACNWEDGNDITV